MKVLFSETKSHQRQWRPLPEIPGKFDPCINLNFKPSHPANRTGGWRRWRTLILGASREWPRLL